MHFRRLLFLLSCAFLRPIETDEPPAPRRDAGATARARARARARAPPALCRRPGWRPSHRPPRRRRSAGGDRHAKVVGTYHHLPQLGRIATAAGCASECDLNAQCTHFLRSTGMADEVSGQRDLYRFGERAATESGVDGMITSYKLCAPPSAPPSPPPPVLPMADGDTIGTISTSWQRVVPRPTSDSRRRERQRRPASRQPGAAPPAG